MKTPELDKLAKVHERSQAAGAFLDWLSSEKNLTLCFSHEHDDGCLDDRGRGNYDCGFEKDDYAPTHQNVEKLLAEYFDIDLEKAENERRQILVNLQKEAK